MSHSEVTASEIAGPLFAGLDPEELGALRELARVMSIPRGQTLFRLGEEATTLWLIRSGTVELTLPLQLGEEVKDVVLDEKTAGTTLAWSALVPPHKLTLGARAASDVALIGFERTALHRLFDARRELHLKMTANLNAVIANRVSLLEALLIRNLQRWVDDKLA